MVQVQSRHQMLVLKEGPHHVKSFSQDIAISCNVQYEMKLHCILLKANEIEQYVKRHLEQDSTLLVGIHVPLCYQVESRLLSSHSRRHLCMLSLLQSCQAHSKKTASMYTIPNTLFSSSFDTDITAAPVFLCL